MVTRRAPGVPHIESRNQRLLLWADAAHHEVASLRHPEWHCSFDTDKALAAATTGLRPGDHQALDLVLVPYAVSLARFRFSDAMDRWLPVSYQLQ